VGATARRSSSGGAPKAQACLALKVGSLNCHPDRVAGFPVAPLGRPHAFKLRRCAEGAGTPRPESQLFEFATLIGWRAFLLLRWGDRMRSSSGGAPKAQACLALKVSFLNLPP